MEKYEKIIVASIVAFGLLMLGLCIKGGIDNFTNKDRRVTVKGLSEKEVDADKVVWTMRLQESANELKPIFARINEEVNIIQGFLNDKGIKGKGTVAVSTFDVTDNYANVWGDNKPLYNYSVSRSVTVTSNDTKFIGELMAKTDELKFIGELQSQSDELIDLGIILDSNNTEYEYTQFQKLKPDMMAEAIANAETTAKQFAENSHSKINKIVEAGQGEFSIDNADIPYKKKIRVVSTITYSLKD